MKRRLRKHPQKHPSEGDLTSMTNHSSRAPYGLIWLVLTVVILALVLLYDRRSVRDAENHVVAGKKLQTSGLYMEALSEYELAFQNRRLGRKARAKAAVAMAEIYYKHLEDYPAAHKYYVQAKQQSASSMADPEVQEHAQVAASRARGAGVFKSRMNTGNDGSTTRTIVQRVELLSEPIQDQRGPVMAEFDGRKVHAGFVLRMLKHRPEFNDPDFREDPEKLKAFVQSLLRLEMAYAAAVSADVHKDPDVSARLYDYQKQLVTQRYMVDRRDLARQIEIADVKAFYDANPTEFSRPGSLELSLIKTDNRSSATEFLKMLRDGTSFRDVASSYSLDKDSAARKGHVGLIEDSATTLPVVGEAPTVVEALFKLPVTTVSDVVAVNDAFYIFRIDSVRPAVQVSLDEARARIEQRLRAQQVDDSRHKLDQELDSAFKPQMDETGLKNFWQFTVEETREADSATSPSAAAELSSGTATTTPSEADSATTQAQAGAPASQ